jgi:tetratricopeptide (TPR) repeat protein
MAHALKAIHPRLEKVIDMQLPNLNICRMQLIAGNLGYLLAENTGDRQLMKQSAEAVRAALSQPNCQPIPVIDPYLQINLAWMLMRLGDLDGDQKRIEEALEVARAANEVTEKEPGHDIVGARVMMYCPILQYGLYRLGTLAVERNYFMRAVAEGRKCLEDFGSIEKSPITSQAHQREVLHLGHQKALIHYFLGQSLVSVGSMDQDKPTVQAGIDSFEAALEALAVLRVALNDKTTIAPEIETAESESAISRLEQEFRSESGAAKAWLADGKK